ncbi:hypothetical protein [Bradyrhizobium cenepequi]
MDTLADYNAWKAKQQQNSVEAASAVLSGVEGQPDEVAGDLNLASEYGKITGNPVPPAPMVSEYRPLFQQAIEREKNRTILSSAPRLAEWLRNPENAVVAKDDLSGLSWWETALGAAGNAVGRGVQRVPQSFNQFLAGAAAQRAQDANMSLGEILRDQSGSIELMRDGKPTGETVPMAPGIETLPLAALRYGQSRLAGLLGIDEKRAAEQFQQKAGLIAKRIDEVPLSPVGTLGKENWIEAGKEGTFGAYMSAIAKDPAAFAAFASETAVESLPMMAAAIGVAAVTRSPTAGAVTMGSTSALTEAGTAPVEFFREGDRRFDAGRRGAGDLRPWADARSGVARRRARHGDRPDGRPVRGARQRTACEVARWQHDRPGVDASGDGRGRRGGRAGDARPSNSTSATF